MTTDDVGLAIAIVEVVLGAGAALVFTWLGLRLAREARQIRREARYDAGREPSDREVDCAFRALVRRLDDPEGR